MYFSCIVVCHFPLFVHISAAIDVVTGAAHIATVNNISVAIFVGTAAAHDVGSLVMS